MLKGADEGGVGMAACTIGVFAADGDDDDAPGIASMLPFGLDGIGGRLSGCAWWLLAEHSGAPALAPQARSNANAGGFWLLSK